MYGNTKSDPCWLEDQSLDEDLVGYICMGSPWDREAVRVTMSQAEWENSPVDTSSREADGVGPFGMEVQDPRDPERFFHCRSFEGAAGPVGGESTRSLCWTGEKPTGDSGWFNAAAVREDGDGPWLVPIALGAGSPEVRMAKVRRVFL